MCVCACVNNELFGFDQVSQKKEIIHIQNIHNQDFFRHVCIEKGREYKNKK